MVGRKHDLRLRRLAHHLSALRIGDREAPAPVAARRNDQTEDDGIASGERYAPGTAVEQDRRMSGIDGTYRPPAGGRPFEPHSSGKRRTVERRQTDRADRRRSGELQPHHAADRREAEIVRTCASGGHRADARSERPRTSEGLHRRKRRRHARTFGDSIRTIGIAGVIDRAFESLAGEIGRRPARKTVVDRITAARRRIFSPQRDRIARRPPHLHAARAAQRRPGLVDPGMYLHKRRRLLRRTQRRLRLVRFDPLATDRCEQDRNEIKPSHRPDPINPPTGLRPSACYPIPTTLRNRVPRRTPSTVLPEADNPPPTTNTPDRFRYRLPATYTERGKRLVKTNVRT